MIGHHDGGRHIQAWNQAGSRTRILEARFLYKRTECAHVSPEGVARERQELRQQQQSSFQPWTQGTYGGAEGRTVEPERVVENQQRGNDHCSEGRPLQSGGPENACCDSQLRLLLIELKTTQRALTGVVQWVELNRKATSQGTHLGCGFGPRSGHIQEVTNQCAFRSLTSMFSLPSSPFVPPL